MRGEYRSPTNTLPRHPKDPVRVATGKLGGRPRLDPDEVRTHRVGIRLSPEKLAAFKAATRRAGVRPFGWSRVIVELIDRYIEEHP